RPTDTWLNGFAAANNVPQAHQALHREMVSLIAMPTAFATLRDGDDALGFGLAVYERQRVGLFDIVIAPQARRRGHGVALTQALLQWGKGVGATAAYLQVREENGAARQLYARLGFQPVYRYHYRVPPSA